MTLFVQSKSDKMLLVILFAFSIGFNSAHSSDITIKKSKIDNRFWESREYVNLLTSCISSSSIRYRETRRLVMCYPFNLPFFSLRPERSELHYTLEIIGKPDSMFTIKDEPLSAHNIYYEYEMLDFSVYAASCKEYTISNLGDGVKNSRIILQVHNLGNRNCNSGKLLLDEQKNKKTFVSIVSDPKMLKILRSVVLVGLKIQPIKGLDFIFNTFWPDHKPDIWEAIMTEIEIKVKKSDMARVYETSKQHLSDYREKLEDLYEAIRMGNTHIENLIMTISVIFVGNENFLMFEDEVTSRQMLPLFGAAMSLFINFHVYAIESAVKFNIQPDNIALLKMRNLRFAEIAHNYIANVYDKNMDYAFNTCGLSIGFYNCIVDVHNQITQDGIQFLPLWRSLSGYKSNDNRLHDPMLYSRSYGESSSELLKSAIFNSTNAFSAITPPFSKHGYKKNSNDEKCFQRVKAKYIYVTYCDELKRVSQMWFSAEKKDMSEFPANMWDTYTLKENEVVLSIIVGGKGNIGQIDYIWFYLSNQKVKTFGYFRNKNSNKVLHEAAFGMKDHFIAQGRILNDDVHLRNRKTHPAKNIVVSYQQRPLEGNSVQL